MPVYHFHLTDGQKVHDPRGLELPDEAAARRYAEGLAHGFVPVVPLLDGAAQMFVEVVDEAGSTVARYAVSIGNAHR
jgi:hypothetical protein